MKADNGIPALHDSGSGNMNHDNLEQVKTAVDYAAAGLTIAVVAAIIPPIAGFLTIIWTLIRISETERFKQLMSWLRGGY